MDTDGSGQGDPHGERTIPYSRFQKLVAQRDELRGQVDTLGGQVQTLTEKGATADTLAEQLRAAQAEVGAMRGRFDSFRSIAAVGITDPDVVEAVEWQYGRLPADDRPPLPDLLATWQSTPSEAPSILRHVFQGLAGEVAIGGSVTRPAPPKPPTGGANDPGAGDVTVEQLAAARASGNLADIAALVQRAGYGRGLFSTTK